jgi:hypothetical protein
MVSLSVFRAHGIVAVDEVFRPLDATDSPYRQKPSSFKKAPER